MIEIDKIKKNLEESLSQKRYTHSIGVADEAVKLAKHYSADADKAYIAGIVHDCAKEIEPATAKTMLTEKYGITVDPIAVYMHKLLHAPLGACIAQSEFGIYDSEILDAVKYHTTAKANMNILTKILYIADYIEPNRDFDGVEELRKLAYENIDKAILLGINFTIEELLKKERMFHPDTVHARNWLLMQEV